MYDTLMQMGRWFGYRPGYVDLCRLFISRDLNEWFCHITHASEELREEFDYMADVAGSTPLQYALRVRTHPGVLQISASNKIRTAVTVRITWSGRLVETYEFQRIREVLQANLRAVDGFIDLLGEPAELTGPGPGYLWRGVSSQDVLTLLAGFRLSENLKPADPRNISRFISKLTALGELTNWSVALISKKNAVKKHTLDINGVATEIGCVERKHDENKSSQYYFLNRQRIASPTDELIDLNDEIKIRALQRTREEWSRKDKRNKAGEPAVAQYPNTEIVRNEFRMPDNPLLLIYLVDMRDNEGNQIEELPVAGYAISFPRSIMEDSTVEFAVHEALLPFFDIQEDDEEEVVDE